MSGPEVGVHVVVDADRSRSVESRLGSDLIQEFMIRVAGSAADSKDLALVSGSYGETAPLRFGQLLIGDHLKGTIKRARGYKILTSSNHRRRVRRPPMANDAVNASPADVRKLAAALERLQAGGSRSVQESARCPRLRQLARLTQVAVRVALPGPPEAHRRVHVRRGRSDGQALNDLRVDWTRSATSGCDDVSADLVKAEVHAVRALKHGIERYAEQVRDAAAHARREIAEADRKTQDAVERRRSEMRKREQDLRQVEATLRQCHENCGELQQQVRQASQRLAQAKQMVDRATKAAQLTATAQSDLLKTLNNIEATIGENSSVASSALASLDAKLAALPHLGVGQATRSFAAGIVGAVEIVGASMNVGRVAGNALQAANVNFPIRDTTISEAVEHQREQEVDYVIKKDLEAKKRMNSGDGPESDL